jgi:nucleotide-binding universal stress UspA family protein
MKSEPFPVSPFRTILFATDFSKRARGAFRSACTLATDESTRIIILHVGEPAPRVAQETGLGALGVPAYVPGEELIASDLLRDQLRESFVPPRSVRTEYRVRRGKPAEEIVLEARESGCDLIVMGTQGRTGLDRVLTGSVAEAVLRHAPCSVLTVRSTDSVEPLAAPFRTIVHPSDLSRHADAALRIARFLAMDLGARLVIIHVVPRATIAGIVPETLMDLENGHEALEQIRKLVDGPDLKYPAETQLWRGQPAVEILDAATKLDADLIVMGSHGPTGLGRLVVGSVAESVMRTANCPVLVIKPPEPGAAASPVTGAIPAAV